MMPQTFGMILMIPITEKKKKKNKEDPIFEILILINVFSAVLVRTGRWNC
jgi:hypothetical protein